MIRYRMHLPVLLTAVLFAGGCGSITQTAVDRNGGNQHNYKTRSGRQVSVALGTVTISAKLNSELKPAVTRYLQHQATATLGQHNLFNVIDRQNRSTDLLAQFMQTSGDTNASAATAIEEATLHIEVIQLKERKGATIRVGLLSKQNKYATASVQAQLVLRNGYSLEASGKGRGEKGAWGVVAMTQRRAMDQQGGVWELDGSMAGTACARALQTAIDDITQQLHRKVRRMKPDAFERWLQ